MFATLPRVLERLNELRSMGLVSQYAIGGAYAMAFHSEPLSTQDLDIFCHLRSLGLLVDPAPIYAHLRSLGYLPSSDVPEAIEIEGVPVQFLVAPNALVDEAIDTATEISVAGVPTRVFDLEHVIAVALDTYRPKDKQRIEHLLTTSVRPIDMAKLETILNRHKTSRPGSTETADTMLYDRWKRFLEARHV